jgi:hypothetical protein
MAAITQTLKIAGLLEELQLRFLFFKSPCSPSPVKGLCRLRRKCGGFVRGTELLGLPQLICACDAHHASTYMMRKAYSFQALINFTWCPFISEGSARALSSTSDNNTAFISDVFLLYC